MSDPPAMTRKEAERQEAAEKLRKWIKPGDTVYTILRHVSRSGMTRDIGVVVHVGDGEFIHPNYAVATVLDWRVNARGDGVRVSGCGMDMGFHLVYELSSVLYPEYECLGEGCPASSHVNDRNAPRGKGVMHRDGYALNQRWL